MQHGRPSRTAMAAAMHRAIHQQLEGGAVFSDPLALPILGGEGAAWLMKWNSATDRRVMRLFIAARHRVADDRLAAGVASGIRQVVVLGAGLDTTALRDLHAGAGLTYFEVDYPATQAWKRDRIAEAGLTPTGRLVFAPVDFERQTLAEGLAAAGFDAAKPAFFIWLGVVPYLTESAIFATLAFAANVPQAQLVFDYANPPDQLDPALKAGHARRAERVAAIGEPWLSFFDSAELAGRLRGLHAVEIDDLGPPEIMARIFHRPPGDRRAGGHILWARWP